MSGSARDAQRVGHGGGPGGGCGGRGHPPPPQERRRSRLLGTRRGRGGRLSGAPRCSAGRAHRGHDRRVDHSGRREPCGTGPLLGRAAGPRLGELARGGGRGGRRSAAGTRGRRRGGHLLGDGCGEPLPSLTTGGPGPASPRGGDSHAPRRRERVGRRAGGGAGVRSGPAAWGRRGRVAGVEGGRAAGIGRQDRAGGCPGAAGRFRRGGQCGTGTGGAGSGGVRQSARRRDTQPRERHPPGRTCQLPRV